MASNPAEVPLTVANEAAAQADRPLSTGEVLQLIQQVLQNQNAAFQETIKTMVTEIRKPPVDPIKVAQAERQAKQKDENLENYWKKVAAKKDPETGCSHLRQNGSCVISWQTNSDGIERGHCPYCNSEFTPADGDLYKRLRRLNRGLMESVRYV